MRETKNKYDLSKWFYQTLKNPLKPMVLLLLYSYSIDTLLNIVNYVKNAIFENNFEQFSHFSTV